MDPLSFFSLLFTSFLAATILPFSSEAAVLAARVAGYNHLWILLAASIGNVGGILLNYRIGMLGRESIRENFESTGKHGTGFKLVHRYGPYSVLLSWLPIVGDPITLVAGAVGFPFLGFMIPAMALRVIRYAVILQFPVGA